MHELGINPVHIVSYVIVFVILYVFVKRFLNKLFLTIDNRQKIIQQGIEDANEAGRLKQIAINESKAEREKILEQAFRESEELLSEAKARYNEIITEANKEKARILENLKAEINTLKEQSKKEGLAEANSIVAAAIRKAFSDVEISEDLHNRFIEQSLKNIKHD